MADKEVFTVDINDKPEFQRLLAGLPQTNGMKAGKVHLAPGKNCGVHSTEEKEELLIFLSGSGQAIIGKDKKRFDVSQGQVCYIPPETIHDIENTGSSPLIYIYCVTPTTIEITSANV